MKRLLCKFMVSVLVPSTALYGIALPARAGREVSCESSSMRRTYCGIGRHGDVRLLSNQGPWPCRQNETWGVEPEGIWVDQNCRGRFSVDDESSGGNSGAAIAAGVIGLAAIAAIAAHNNRRDDNPPPPPDYGGGPNYGGPGYGYPTWMIGRYSGYAYRDRQNLTVEIGPSGRVISRGDREPSYGRVFGDQVAFDNGVRFFVQPIPGGLRLTQVQDRNHVIDLQRVR